MGLKARVKATGKIVEVEEYHKYLETGWKYRDNAGTLYKPSALYFSDEAVIDYWTRLEHQYAGMAMNALLLTNNIRNGDLEGMRECNTNAMAIAYALIQELKEKEERK